jgi:aspartate carbamoyltransferase|tara:strand:- start:55 stop:990 length:936 start_codon:yes stop_codon:yes gene_type:complete
MHSLISIADISKEHIEIIFKLATKYKIINKNSRMRPNNKSNTTLKPFNIGIMFFEPSTRTFCSFQSAVNRCGGSFITYIHENSSSKKGESLRDTIKTMEAYCDLLIIRHPDKNIFNDIKTFTHVPLINAGDGSGEDPTQALMDLYTIHNHFDKKLSSILFVGDLKNNRSVHSLIKLLYMFYDNNIKIYFLEINGLEFDETVFPETSNFKHITKYDDCISLVDVVYMTRIQLERLDQTDPTIIEQYKGITMTPEVMVKMKNISILLHPLPRNYEINPICDLDPRAKYFQNVENGVYVRMGLLNYCLNGFNYS